jgi:hypothetical protein
MKKTFLQLSLLLIASSGSAATGLKLKDIDDLTPFTRQLNTNATAAGARTKLGFVGTNVTFLTNAPLNAAQFDTGNGNVNIKSGAYGTNLNLVGTQTADRLLATNFPGGSTIFVDAVNGNDSTGARGRFDKPFQTPTNAAKVAVSGDTIFLNPGVYHITNQFGLLVPTNCSLVANLGTVIIDNRNTNGRIGVVLSDNCTVSGLIITNLEWGNGSAGNCMACIGLHDFIGNVGGTIHFGATNFTINNCISFGDCDNWHFATTNNWTGTINYSICYFKDDGFASSGSASSPRFVLNDCVFIPNGAPADGQVQNAFAIGSDSGNGVFNHCSLNASNGTGLGSCTISLQPGIAFTCTMNNCTISAPPGSNTFSVASAGTLNLNTCVFDPTQILNSDPLIGGTINISPQSVMATNFSVVPVHDFSDHDLTLSAWSSGDSASTFVLGGDGSISVPATNSGALGTVRGWIPFKANGVTYHVPVYQ